MNKIYLIIIGIFIFIGDKIKIYRFFIEVLVVSIIILWGMAGLYYIFKKEPHGNYHKGRITLHKQGYPALYCFGSPGGIMEFTKGSYQITLDEKHGWQIENRDESFHVERCYINDTNLSLRTFND